MNQTKASLFARCFAHCLECEEIELSKDEQADLIHFCQVVDDKGYVERALARIENRQKAKSNDETEEEQEGDDPADITKWSTDELERFLATYPLEAAAIQVKQELIQRGESN